MQSRTRTRLRRAREQGAGRRRCSTELRTGFIVYWKLVLVCINVCVAGWSMAPLWPCLLTSQSTHTHVHSDLLSKILLSTNAHPNCCFTRTNCAILCRNACKESRNTTQHNTQMFCQSSGQLQSWDFRHYITMHTAASLEQQSAFVDYSSACCLDRIYSMYCLNSVQSSVQSKQNIILHIIAQDITFFSFILVEKNRHTWDRRPKFSA